MRLEETKLHTFEGSRKQEVRVRRQIVMAWNRTWSWVVALLCILSLNSPARACEPPELTWAKRAGGSGFENAQAVARAGDRWVVCGGYNGVATFGAGELGQAQLVSTGGSDGFVACYASDGTLRWARTTTGAAGHSADVSDVAANAAGQIFVTGTFSGSVTFGGVTLTAQGANDSFVASYDANGTLLWARHVAGPGSEVASSVCALGTSSIAVVGRFDQLATLYGTTSTWTVTSAGQYDAFYAVFTTAGALSFARGEGGAGDERADEVVASEDGSTFAITGQMLGASTFGLGHGTTTTFSSSVWSVFVASYWPSSTLRWVKRASHAVPTGGSFGHGLTTLGDGSVVVAGQVSGSVTFGADEANETTLTVPTGVTNAFLARYGPDGQLAWARCDGGGSFSSGASVCTTAGGGLLVVGGFEGSPVFASGETREITLSSAGGRDGFVARYAAGGTFLWAQRTGGAQFDEARGVAATGAGDAALCGTFYGSISFDSAGQPGTTSLTSAGWSDVLLARYAADPSGIAWARTEAGSGSMGARAVASCADGSVLVSGAAFDVILGANEPTETALNGYFLARYRADGTLAWARNALGGPVASYEDGSSVVTQGGSVARYSADGALAWLRFTTTATGYVDPRDIGAFSDGSFVVTGIFSGTAVFGIGEPAQTTVTAPSGFAAYIARYHANGTLAWARGNISTASSTPQVWGMGVASCPDGSCIATGFFYGTVVFGSGETAEAALQAGDTPSTYVARYASDGSLVWARGVSSAGGPVYALGVAAFPDASAVVVGYAASGAAFGAGEPAETTVAPADTGGFLARYNADGTLAWVRSGLGVFGGTAREVSSSADGNCVVAGDFRGSVVLGRGELAETLLSAPPPSSQQMYVARYRADGTLVWAYGTRQIDIAAGATHYAQPTAVAAGWDGSAVVVGGFNGDIAFGSSTDEDVVLEGAGFLIARYRGPVWVQGPESVVAECAGDGATEVTFDVQVAGCPGEGVLTVRDVTQNRLLHNGSVGSGTTTVGPHVFPDGLSVVEAEVVAGGTRLAFDSFTVQIADTTPPVLSGYQATTLELQGLLTTLFKSILGITATDACDPAPTVTFSPAAVPLGTTDVLVTAMDATGNASTATIPVTIVDTTPPIFLMAPADIGRECTNGSVIVNFDILASDLSGTATIVCTDETGRAVDPAGTTFDDGIHTVTCVATDGSGNSATWGFTITVSDNTAPVLVVPDDITMPNEPGESFAYVAFAVTATDNCDPSVPIVCTTLYGEVQSGDAFPVGLTVVACNARDLAGNEATATFQILVQDVEPPGYQYSVAEFHTDAVGTPLAITPEDLVLQAFDNCDPVPVVLLTPSILSVGTTTVTVTVRDAAGNETVNQIEVTVLLAGQETTDAGTDIVVAPEAELPDGSAATVTVSFEQVDGGGVTTITTSDSGQPLPDGFKLGNPPIYYDVSTTAQFSGTIELCFTWQEGQIANEANARLFHYEGGTWVDVTTSVDTVANMICGQVTSLSPFVLVEPSYTFGGILPPIDADGSSLFKRGRVVPVKFQLIDPDGTYAADATVRLKIVKISETVLGTVEEEIDPATVGSANTDDLFRYDADGHQFIYNLATSGLTAGTYRLEILPDDGSRHTARISVRD